MGSGMCCTGQRYFQSHRYFVSEEEPGIWIRSRDNYIPASDYLTSRNMLWLKLVEVAWIVDGVSRVTRRGMFLLYLNWKCLIFRIEAPNEYYAGDNDNDNDKDAEYLEVSWIQLRIARFHVAKQGCRPVRILCLQLQHWTMSLIQDQSNRGEFTKQWHENNRWTMKMVSNLVIIC